MCNKLNKLFWRGKGSIARELDIKSIIALRLNFRLLIGIKIVKEQHRWSLKYLLDFFNCSDGTVPLLGIQWPKTEATKPPKFADLSVVFYVVWCGGRGFQLFLWVAKECPTIKPVRHSSREKPNFHASKIWWKILLVFFWQMLCHLI